MLFEEIGSGTGEHGMNFQRVRRQDSS